MNLKLRLLLPLALASVPLSAQTTHPAAVDPDRFAWRLFTEINQPIPGDPQGRVMWESWALARDVFADPQTKPDWTKLTGRPRAASDFETLLLQDIIAARAMHPGPTPFTPAFDPLVGERNETRLNQAAFDFLADNDLYYVEGQEAYLAPGKKIDFPVPAREIKAQWRRIKPAEAGLYHTATLKKGDGSTEIWGLTSLHITTKDLPNWFWATFEHKSNPDREKVIPSRDTAGLPAALKGTKWENYVLRGSQIDFVNASGKSTILASSQIEKNFQSSSSCITCHSRASIGPKSGPEANRLDVFIRANPTTGPVGSPDPTWFVQNQNGVATTKYIQMDFVWSLFRAGRRTP